MIQKILHKVKGKTARLYKNHLKLQAPDTIEAFYIDKRGMKKFQFWQPGGGFDSNFWSAGPVHSAIEYIEHNPVRAKLAVASDRWPWSSSWARKHQKGLIPDECGIPLLMMP